MPDKPIALTPSPEGYADWFAELILLYWQIGSDILARQAAQGWGAKVIERLAHDLRTAFPSLKGFSSRNLKYMRSFAEAWPDEAIVQQAVGQLPWGHKPSIGLLLCKNKNKVVAEYALGDKTQPMSIAEYKLRESLPETFETNLPSIEQIERELEGIEA